MLATQPFHMYQDPKGWVGKSARDRRPQGGMLCRKQTSPNLCTGAGAGSVKKRADALCWAF